MFNLGEIIPTFSLKPVENIQIILLNEQLF